MDYTIEQLLAGLLFTFDSVDDIDLDVIINIFSMYNMHVTNSPIQIHEGSSNICRFIATTHVDKNLNTIYSLGEGTSKNVSMGEFGYQFLGESIDIELHNMILMLKTRPREWLLERINKDSKRSSLVNSTLRKELKRSRERGYIKTIGMDISPKGNRKINSEERKTIILAKVKKLTPNDINYTNGDIKRLYSMGYLMTGTFVLTEKGLKYLESAKEKTSIYDYLFHGTKSFNNK